MLRKDDGAEDAGQSDGTGLSTAGRGRKQIHQSCRGDGAHPGQEAEAVEPRADRVPSVRDWPAHLDADLSRIASELDPVGYQEGDGGQRPNGREEAQVTKLQIVT